MQPSYRGAILGAAGLFAFGVAVAAIVAVSGAYNFAADAPHFDVTSDAIEYMRDRSVEVRSSGLMVPKLTDAKMIGNGASDYDEMCTSCHLAPGLAENEMRPGLYPKPPILYQAEADDPAEQFWIVKHGLKMSGMPAWGVTHSDTEIWNIVAFLQKLPALSPSQYRAIVASAAGHHEQDHMGMAH
ncbi:MAG TPA: cytochrome c [Rhizomicrobium sp.]